MALIKVEKLYKVTSKGRTYYYAWRGGPRIEAAPGTKEFFDEIAYHRDPTAGLDRRRMATWVALFKASPEWAAFSRGTTKDWGPLLDNASEKFGKLSIGTFDKPAIRGEIKAWRDQWRDRPRTADKAKQALSRLCAFIMEEGHLATNPCEGIANIYSSNRSEIIWSEDDMAALAAAASQEITWAARFAALTGLRQAACLEATWNRVKGNHLDMRGTKGLKKGRGLIPIYAALKTLLDEMPRRALTILTTTEGTPWKTGFGASWNTAMHKAGLAGKELHFHDLRGNAATHFYHCGLTSREIADTMGWTAAKVENLIEIYVKRDEIMQDRVRKLEQISTPVGAKTGTEKS